MDSWKAFDQNPVTHSVAHHLVAIAELLDEYGYARVSDVARRLEITRGSASITLKSLKHRGLVTEDDRRFLGLSAEGEAIARSIRARKAAIGMLFVQVLGVEPRQADEDTCKIEHLISVHTAERATRFLRFLTSRTPEVQAFQAAWSRFDEPDGHDPAQCPCHDICRAAGEAAAPRRVGAASGRSRKSHEPR